SKLCIRITIRTVNILQFLLGPNHHSLRRRGRRPRRRLYCLLALLEAPLGRFLHLLAGAGSHLPVPSN
ncbi:hypothetical protein HPP92_018014, partial [Vanilla planifolia]